MDINQIISMELEGVYGTKVLQDMQNIISLYNFYDGQGQDWTVPEDLDYEPTKIKTNMAKKLIKQEARFMFGRTPEVLVKPADKQDEESALEIQRKVRQVLKDNRFADKLIKGARDCFIGKRIALKLHASKEEGIKIMFKPSLEFIYETDPDDVDKLRRIVFFYQTNDAAAKEEQRIWKQKYEMMGNRCMLDEAIYDGYGRKVEETYADFDTGLDFVPAYVIINDGLTGDLSGESDISEIADNQDIYNMLKSDDIDALKFNMFPQTAVINASGASVNGLTVAPGALIDLQSEDEGETTDIKKVEAGFSYDQRFENSINRVKNDMYDLLNVPNVGLEQLKGLMQSGKSMKALYWDMITRCEEKWTAWGPALEWLVEKIIAMMEAYKIDALPQCEYSIEIEHLYPILEDEETERLNDMAEVTSQVRSRRSYISKWNINEDPDAELEQIAKEQALLQDAYMKGLEEPGDGVNGE